MKSFNKLIIAATTFAALAMPAFAAGSLENGTATCGVPVCSLADGLAELRTLNTNQRGNFLLNFKNTHKSSTDLKVLENMFLSGKEAVKVTVELKDEDWIWREANAILNLGLIGLAKHSPVEGEKFVGLFKQLANQQARYDMIAHWASKLNSIENVGVLEQLTIFAAGARDHSIAVKDESWVAREASMLLSNITIKLIHLDPAHEGLYQVEVDQRALDNGAFPFDRVAVLDSSSEKNLVVVFINTKHRHIVYRYNHVEMAGNKLSGKFISTSEVSNKFELVIDRATGEVSGSIETTNLDTIDFSGKQLFSTRASYQGTAPGQLSNKDVLGKLEGEIGGVKGTLTVKSFSPNVYSASFKSASGSVLLHFQGKFFAEKGVLSLTSGEKMKLTISLRETEEGVKWVGSSFTTTNGTMAAAKFDVLK